MNAIKLYSFAFLMAGFLLAGCGSGSGKSQDNFGSNVTSEPIGNNGALLRGGAVGKNITPVSQLRKPLVVTVQGDPQSFTVGEAFVAKARESSSLSFFLFPITNTGSQTLCFVKLNGIKYRDVSGNVLTPPVSSSGTVMDWAYVLGSVQRVSTSVTTDTCIAPGATGRLTNIEQLAYSNVNSMEFTFSSSSSLDAPLAKVTPIDYTYESSKLIVLAKNVGTKSALVGGNSQYHVWQLVDENNKPLIFGIVDSTAQTFIAPGSVATMIDNISYDGVGSRLEVFVDFEDQSGGTQKPGIAARGLADCSAEYLGEALQACLIREKNILINSIESNLR